MFVTLRTHAQQFFLSVVCLLSGGKIEILQRQNLHKGLKLAKTELLACLLVYPKVKALCFAVSRVTISQVICTFPLIRTSTNCILFQADLEQKYCSESHLPHTHTHIPYSCIWP